MKEYNWVMMLIENPDRRKGYLDEPIRRAKSLMNNQARVVR